jgi:hypothetical protein
MQTFADLPSEVERRVLDGARVVVVLLDAFGRRFLDRYGEGHPFLRRMLADGEVVDLVTQFPSTTAAHVTTMHSGQPVGAHGIYEWNVYEPSLDRVITPLRFSYAGDREGDTLRSSGLDVRSLLPPERTFYERLGSAGAEAFAFQPAHFSPSTYDSAALRGCSLRPYAHLPDGLAGAAEAVRGLSSAYAYVYFDAIDATGHMCGPSSREFDDTVRYALDALEAALPLFAGTQLVVTADHGQVDVDPERTLWLDELWPPLGEMLTQRPAGSARDVFLHVAQGRVEEVVSGLSDALGEDAVVLEVADMVTLGLFGEVGPRLLARLADVCVLPSADRMAWLRSAADMQRRFRGHHGGLDPQETSTWAGTLEG